jgi:hypothetical protein
MDDSRKEAVLAAVKDDGRSQAILVVTVVFLAISLVSVGLRCFVRTRVVRAFGWDDTLMLIAMVGDATLGRDGSLIHMFSNLGLQPRLRHVRNSGIEVRHGKEATLLRCRAAEFPQGLAGSSFGLPYAQLPTPNSQLPTP